MPPPNAPSEISLARLTGLALVTGMLGFGGGWAIVAHVRQRMVEERRWVAASDFVECMAVAGALPGTLTANLFSIVGYRLAGWRGALLGTVAFLAPSVVLMMAIGAIYDRVRGLEAVRVLFDGVNPAVLGVIGAVAIELGRDALRARRDWGVAVLASVALATRALSLLEVVEIAAVVGLIGARGAPPRAPLAAFAWLAPVPVLGSLFLVFAKIGAATFGGGLAMIPAIAHEAIGRGWVDAQAFADAIALGQLTPGPVAIAATFIGYRAGGASGALAATLGIFLPPFVTCVVAARSLSAFRESPVVQGLLAGIAPAVVGILVAATYALGEATVHGAVAVGIALLSFALRVRFPRVTPLVPIAIGAALAALAHAIHRIA